MGKLAREGVNHHSRVVSDLAEQAYLSAGRLSQLALTAYNVGVPGTTVELTNAQMDELRALGALLARLSSEANAIQKNTTASLSKLDSTLTAIDEAWNTAFASSRAQPGEIQQTVGGYSVDVLRLSNEFAEEVVVLARQSMMLTREMRAHIAPFRLDQVQSSDMDLPMYTPGTR
jgi:hypothetical protein